MMTHAVTSGARGAGEGTYPDTAIRSYFRHPEGALGINVTGLRQADRVFRFGSATCFGSCSVPHLPSSMDEQDRIADVSAAVKTEAGTVTLPFDPAEIVTNLTRERYLRQIGPKRKRIVDSAGVRWAYYGIRRLLPVSVRKHLQRRHLADWKRIPFPGWPVERSVDAVLEGVLLHALRANGNVRLPFVWFWPKGHSSCLIMTHDIEEAAGRNFCTKLMDIDERFGVRASFQVIPESRYRVAPEFLNTIRARGHEVNVHDLNHDGNLYRDRPEYLRRMQKIRQYAGIFQAKGFRAGAMYRNLEWYGAMPFDYDMSVPNVAHLEPQRGGCCTIMPFLVDGIVVLPLTTTQDYSLFHIFGNYSIDLWRTQINEIIRNHGLLSFNIHPDYIVDEKAFGVYQELLAHLNAVTRRQNIWTPLPKELSQWWRLRDAMDVVDSGGKWTIRGEGSEQAVVAFASLQDDRLVYTVEP